MKANKITLYLFLASLVCFLIAAGFFVVINHKANKQIQEKNKIIAELQQKNEILEKKIGETSDLYNELEINYDKLVEENDELKTLTTTETEEEETEEVTEAEVTTEEVTTQAPRKEEVTTAAPKKEEVTTECVITTTTAPTEEVTEAISEEPTTADTTLSKELTGDEYFEGVKLQYSAPYNITDNKLTATKGVVRFNGHKECYYTQTLLPGKGLYLPGRHVAEDGTIRDGDGYICVAANLKFLPRYTKVMTSLGPGKVYDTGCAYGTVDIYTDW